MSNNYAWRRPTATSTVDVPRDIINLAEDADATVKGIDNRVATTETRVRLGLSTARPSPTAGALYFDTDMNRLMVGVSVGGLDYWVPFPGTKIIQVQQTSSQSIPDATHTPLQWHYNTGDPFLVWAAGAPSRIKPTFPGHYLLGGGVSYATNATGYRELRWHHNGALMSACVVNGALTASGQALASRSYIKWLNGTSDYVEMIAWQNSGGPLGTSVTGGYQTHAMVVYLGAGKDASTP